MNAEITETKTPVDEPKPSNARPPHPFLSLCAERAKVVIQQKGGIIIRGKMKRLNANILSLTDARVTGKNREVVVPWILVEVNSIAHLHPDVANEESQPTTGPGVERGS